MTLTEALFGVIPYWGVKRTINAYEKAVSAGVSATRAVESLYAAMSDLEQEKVRWENIDDLRKAAEEGVKGELEEAEAKLGRAKVANLQAKNALTVAKMESEEFDSLLADKEKRAR